MTRRLQDLLTASAERSPGSTALLLGDEVMTYAELAATTDRIARVLLDRGVRPGDRVGVLAAKAPWTIAALIGTLKAGGVYVPVDSASPAPRVARIVRSAEPAVLLADATATELIDGLVEEGVDDLVVGSLAEPLAGARFTSAFARDDIAATDAAAPAVGASAVRRLTAVSVATRTGGSGSARTAGSESERGQS